MAEEDIVKDANVEIARLGEALELAARARRLEAQHTASRLVRRPVEP